MTAPVPRILASQIAPGERVLWVGRPSAAAFITRNWMFSVVGAFWLALTVMWIESVAVGRLPSFFYVIAIPLLGAAAWMTLGHVLWAAVEFPNVHYMLTDWRVLMTHGGFRIRVRTIPLAKIAEFDLCPRRNGYGDIRLGLELGFWDGARWAKAGLDTGAAPDTVLRGIPSCTEVYSKLADAIRQLRQPA